MGFSKMDNVRLIVIPSIFAQWTIPNSNSFEIAETDTKAPPNPECTAFLMSHSNEFVDYRKCHVSIDLIEVLTEIDFFPNSGIDHLEIRSFVSHPQDFSMGGQMKTNDSKN